MKRTAPLLAITAVLALALSACGSSTTGSDASGATDENLLQHVESSGVLTVGTEGTYRPFSYHEADKLTGFDVEVIEAVGEQLGLKVEFQETQWDGIFAGLEAGRFDVIANQVSVTPEREEKYLLSKPYNYSSGVIVTKSDNTDITSFDSLKGKTTAQSLTSSFHEDAKAAGAKIQAVEGWAQAVTLLKQGRVDATINDKLTYLDSQNTNPDDGIKIAAESEEKTETVVALKKDQPELRDAINGALDELSADGTLTKISEKYFGEDITK